METQETVTDRLWDRWSRLTSLAEKLDRRKTEVEASLLDLLALPRASLVGQACEVVSCGRGRQHRLAGEQGIVVAVNRRSMRIVLADGSRHRVRGRNLAILEETDSPANGNGNDGAPPCQD